jgi:hypothetical protein
VAAVSDEPRHEWARAPHFAEVAEALGLNTDQVLASSLRDGRWFVMFTPRRDGRGDVWMAVLERHDDGLLQVRRRRRTGQTIEGFIAEAKRGRPDAE